MAPWSDGHLYPAVIASIEGDMAHITFPEYNESATVLVSLLRKVDSPSRSSPQWAVGSKCLAAWTDGNYYPAVIDQIEGENVHVTFPEYNETGSSLVSLLKRTEQKNGPSAPQKGADSEAKKGPIPPPKAPLSDSPMFKTPPSRASVDKGPAVPAKPPGDASPKTPASRLVPTPPVPKSPGIGSRSTVTLPGGLKVGDKCTAMWSDGNYYPAVIDSIAGENAQVTFPEYDESATLALSMIRKVEEKKPAGPRPPEKAASPSYQVGDTCSAPWSDGNYYAAKITALAPTSADIKFMEYDESATVPLTSLKMLRAPEHSRLASISIAPTTELVASGEMCGECKKPVVPPYLKYKGQAYHKDCIEGQLPKCKRCGLVATGKLRKHDGQKYHVACYTCFTCHATKDKLITAGPEVYCEPCSVVPKKQFLWQDMGVVPLAHTESSRKLTAPETRGLKSLTMTLKSSLHLTKAPEVEPAPMLSDAEIIAQMKLAAGPILENQLKRAIEEGAEQEDIDRLRDQLAAMTE